MIKAILSIRDAIISWGIDVIFEVVVWVKKVCGGASAFPFGLDSLRTFPKGSLGHSVAAFLDAHHFTFIPNYETHDIRHVLYDYPMNLEGEVLMMAFQAGCKGGWKNVFVLIALTVSIPTMPERWTLLWRNYQRGASLKNIDIKPDFIALLPLPLHEARAQIGLEFAFF
ncbi:MAG: hypothetical protein RI894_1527 [Bacteroidota bacterium]